MKVLIIYASAGGGHKSAAKALANSIISKGHKAEIVDGLVGRNQYIRQIFSQGYGTIIDQFPWFWNVCFFLADYTLVKYLSKPVFALLAHQSILSLIEQHQPDKIVSTYFGWTPIIRKIIDSRNKSVELFTCVSDKFTPSNLWFIEPDSRFILLSKQAKAIALKNGILPKNIQVFEDILDEKYNFIMSDKDKIEFMRSCGLVEQKPVILVVGGGESMPNGFKIVKELLKTKPSAQFVIVCGRNNKLKIKLERLTKENPDICMRIYGFVDFLYELMNISTVIVCKAGPATIMEALLLHKPIIISSYIWGQEKGNVDFVINNQLGYYKPNPKELANQVIQLLSDSSMVHLLQESCLKQNFKTDISSITDYIIYNR